MADVPLIVISDNVSSERRITPSWTIGQLKTKLEPITGVPPSSQRLSLKTAVGESIPIESADEDSTHLTNFPLSPYAELHVSPLLLWDIDRTIDGHSWVTAGASAPVKLNLFHAEGSFVVLLESLVKRAISLL